MWHRGVPIVLVALAACKSKAPGTESAGSAAPKTTAPADAAAAAPAAKPSAPARPKLAPAQLVEIRTHMKAAWAAQKAKKWEDAVTELEAALKVAPGDARALTELGWSAMNAGDLAKARKIDEQAVRVAIDPKVKAAGLYNLGVVQAKLGDHEAAQQSFTQSLALRPNKTVEAELAKLGGAAEATCPAGKSPCYCAVLDAWGSVDGDPAESCKPSPDVKSPVPGWHVYRVHGMHGDQDELLDEHDQVVTVIASDDDSIRRMAFDKLSKAELRTVGGHRVAWLEVTGTDSTQTMDEDRVTDESAKTVMVTICAIGDAKTPTNCALRDAPRSIEHTIDHSTMAEDGTTKDVAHEETETVVDYTLADDGTITAKLVKGKVDSIAAYVLGTHKLW